MIQQSAGSVDIDVWQADDLAPKLRDGDGDRNAQLGDLRRQVTMVS